MSYTVSIEPSDIVISNATSAVTLRCCIENIITPPLHTIRHLDVNGKRWESTCWCLLIAEGKVFIKNKTKVACKWVVFVVCFRELLFKTNDEKFSLGRVKSKKICRHPGGDLFQSSLEVGDTWVKVARMECILFIYFYFNFTILSNHTTYQHCHRVR